MNDIDIFCFNIDEIYIFLLNSNVVMHVLDYSVILQISNFI